jgi:hypothetical protein
MNDCCGGNPDICAPVVEKFSAACCVPAKETADV